MQLYKPIIGHIAKRPRAEAYKNHRPFSRMWYPVWTADLGTVETWLMVKPQTIL